VSATSTTGHVVVNGGHELVGGPEVMLQVTSVVPTFGDACSSPASRISHLPDWRRGDRAIVVARWRREVRGREAVCALGAVDRARSRGRNCRESCDGVVVCSRRARRGTSPAGFVRQPVWRRGPSRCEPGCWCARECRRRRRTYAARPSLPACSLPAVIDAIRAGADAAVPRSRRRHAEACA